MSKNLNPEQSFIELPSPRKIPFGEVIAVSLSASTNTTTHGLHRYPAKFIPQIPRWAISNYSALGDTVLDPFVGSGTTMVEALSLSRAAIGVDLDPMACLISEAKTSELDGQRLNLLASKLLSFVECPRTELVIPLAGVSNFGHWFTEAAWSSLQALRSGIERLPLSEAERAFFLVVFSSILRIVSNADDQTQKTYVSGTLKKVPPEVLPTFEKALNKAIAGMISLNGVSSREPAHVFNCSATAIPLSDDSVDLIITSPPYLDSVDYMYNLMLEYFWLGSDVGVHSRADFNSLRKKTIGAKQPIQPLDIPDSIQHLIKLEDVPAYRKAAIAPYFAGMALHFAEAARVLKPGGRYVLVVGNSRSQTGMVRVHDALIILAAEVGLNIEHAFGYRIRRHYMKFPRKGRGGIILVDWVITLRKGEAVDGVPHQLPFVDEQLAPDEVAH